MKRIIIKFDFPEFANEIVTETLANRTSAVASLKKLHKQMNEISILKNKREKTYLFNDSGMIVVGNSRKNAFKVPVNVCGSYLNNIDWNIQKEKRVNDTLTTRLLQNDLIRIHHATTIFQQLIQNVETNPIRELINNYL